MISLYVAVFLFGVADSFAESANAFYPFSFTPERLNSQTEIREAQERVFEWVRKNLSGTDIGKPLALNLKPADMRIKMLGEYAAVVSWHSNRLDHSGRRTSVFERVDGKWLMVHHHASNVRTSH